MKKLKAFKTASKILLLLLALFGIASFLRFAFGSGFYRPPDVGPLGILCITAAVISVFTADSAVLLFMPIVLYAIYLPPFFRMKKHPALKTVLFILFLILHFLDMALFRLAANTVLWIASDLIAVAAATALYILSKKEMTPKTGDKPGAGPTGAPSV